MLDTPKAPTKAMSEWGQSGGCCWVIAYAPTPYPYPPMFEAWHWGSFLGKKNRPKGTV